jgi:hypothetical protein
MLLMLTVFQGSRGQEKEKEAAANKPRRSSRARTRGLEVVVDTVIIAIILIAPVLIAPIIVNGGRLPCASF